MNSLIGVRVDHFFEEEIEHLNMVEILERLVGVWQAGTFE